jgi:hypothetical protein
VSIYDTVHITCKVTSNGTGTVWLGWRAQTPNRFRRVQMYDDGLHFDGAPNDSVYGASLVANTAITEYYIYAENTNAGVFSPVRAEYEFYTIQAVVNAPQAGDLVINEFLADNVNCAAVDETGKHEDWIEVYNMSPAPLRLLGTYMTDDYAIPHKWAFPDIILPVNGYALIWADEDQGDLTNLHCNFKLAATGEQLMLTAIDSTVIDSVTFPAQTTDVSWGRCPNGNGPFGAQPFMTVLFSNCGVFVPELAGQDPAFMTYPNPARTQVTLVTTDTRVQSCRLLNYSGAMVMNATMPNGQATVDLNDFAAGMYLYQAIDKSGAVLHTGKICVVR